MHFGKIMHYAIITAMASAFAAAPLTSFAVQGKKAAHPVMAVKEVKKKVVIQVSDADPKKWALALNNAANVQEDLGKENVDVEIVAYGPGLGMLKLESEAGERVKNALVDFIPVCRINRCRENRGQKTAGAQPD